MDIKNIILSFIIGDSLGLSKLNNYEDNNIVIKDNKTLKYPNIYKNDVINYLNTYQKICLIFIKYKWIFGLKLCVKIKRVIQKVR